MIKILYKDILTINKWIDSSKNPNETSYHLLKDWIEDLVDKGNWTIIAATIEYIILQKRDYTPKALIKGDVVELPSIEGAEELDSPQ